MPPLNSFCGILISKRAQKTKEEDGLLKIN
jgi:hypothetical protein